MRSTLTSVTNGRRVWHDDHAVSVSFKLLTFETSAEMFSVAWMRWGLRPQASA